MFSVLVSLVYYWSIFYFAFRIRLLLKKNTQFKTQEEMIKAPGESKQGIPSANQKAVHAFDEFMTDAADGSRKLSPQFSGSVADDQFKNFERFDTSFSFDEITQFQDSFHFCAVGLDSGYCTSSASHIESSNKIVSFLQRSLLSIDRSSQCKPALLDTSHSHNEDEDNTSISSSCSLFGLKTEQNTKGDEKAGSNADGLVEKSRLRTAKDSNTQVQKRPTVTSSRRLITSKHDTPVFDRKVRRTKSSGNLFEDMQLMKSKPRFSSVSNLNSFYHSMESSSQKNYEFPKQEPSSSRIITKLDSLTTNMQSSSNHSQGSRQNPLRSPPCRASSGDLKRIKPGQWFSPSDHYSSSSSGHSQQRRTLDKAVKRTKSGQRSNAADLSSSSSGNSRQRRPLNRDVRRSKWNEVLSQIHRFPSSSSSGQSQQRRPFNKNLKRSKSGNALTNLAKRSSSSSGHSQQRGSLERDIRRNYSGQSLKPADLLSSSLSGHSHQNRSSGKVGLCENECFDGLGFTSSHHSQSSSRRKGLNSSRHLGQGSSHSDMTTHESMEFPLSQTETPPSTGKQHRSQSRSRSRSSSFSDESLPRELAAAPKERRGRSRSRPRIKSAKAKPETEIKANRRRCHSQPRLITKSLSDNFRLEHPLIFNNETRFKNDHLSTLTREEEISIAPLDARTAARIERARASREKYLAKLQKEKEKTRNEKRNPELLRTCSTRQLHMFQ